MLQTLPGSLILLNQADFGTHSTNYQSQTLPGSLILLKYRSDKTTMQEVLPSQTLLGSPFLLKEEALQLFYKTLEVANPAGLPFSFASFPDTAGDNASLVANPNRLLFSFCHRDAHVRGG